MIRNPYLRFVFQLLAFVAILSLGSLFWIKFLEYKLTSYELSTVNGSLTYFTELVNNDDFDKIYDLGNTVVTNYNDKDEYLQYLRSYLDAVDTNDISYELVYDDTDYDIHYYQFFYDGIYFSNLEVYPQKNDKTAYTVSFINSDVLEIQFPDVYEDTVFNGIKAPSIEEVNGTYSILAKLKQYDYLPTPTYTVKITNFVDFDYKLEIDDSKYISFRNKDENVVTVAYKVDETTTSQLTDLTQEFAEAYSKFISNDGYRSEMLNYVNWDSDLYQSLNSFDNQFFSSHTSYEFNNFKFSDVGLLKKNFYTITVDYDYTIIDGSNIKVYPTKFELIISDYLGGLKIFDMKVLNSEYSQ